MADLIVIGYDSKEKAEQVLDELLDLNRDYLVDLQDAAVVYRNEKGKLKVTSREARPRRVRSAARSGGC